MLRVAVVMSLFLSGLAFGGNDGSQKALNNLAACLPEHNASCALAGTCTKQQFCAACTAVSAQPIAKCGDKAYVYAAVEGVYGWTEGSCKQECSVGSSVDFLRVRANAEAGSEVVIAQTKKKGSALGLVFTGSGGVSLAEVSYSGKELRPGTIVTTRDDSISQPIQESLSCIRGSSSPALQNCFLKLKNCSSAMSKATRCAVCTATTSCQQAREFFRDIGQLTCSGC